MSLQNFLGRLPIGFNVVILSPHGFFGQANVLGQTGHRRTGDCLSHYPVDQLPSFLPPCVYLDQASAM